MAAPALLMLAGAVALSARRVDAHGQGEYRTGRDGAPLSLRLQSGRKVEDWDGSHFRPTFSLPPRPVTRVCRPGWGDCLEPAQAPVHEELGTPVLVRDDGRGILVIYDRPLKVPAVDSVYDEHHRYGALYQVTKDVPGKAKPTGEPEWVLDLEGLYPGILEMHDAVFDGKLLYLGIALNGYAKILEGKTGYVACVDPSSAELVWRTAPLVSNGPLLLLADHLVTGYGFTAEPDFLFVLDRKSGAQVQKVPVPNAMEDLVEQDGILYVRTYDRYLTFKVEGKR